MDFLEQLLGVNLDVTTRTLIAFAVVLIVIVLVAWLFRRLSRGPARTGRRGRIARLAILEAIQIDQRRRLVLLRRDNAEHLILIGGGGDLVIERGIQRAPLKPGARGGERVETPARQPTPARPVEPPAPRPVPAARAAPPPPPGSSEKSATEPQLAEMADRLKASLRQPVTAGAPAQGQRRPDPAATAEAPAEETAAPTSARRSE